MYSQKLFGELMAKRNPFDYVKSINKKNYEYDLAGYNPYLTNRCFAMHMDIILLAEEMNQAHQLGPQLQYDFYYYSVRKGKRFGFPPKPPEDDYLPVVMEYYNYSRQKAQEALRILTPTDIKMMLKSMDKGGNT